MDANANRKSGLTIDLPSDREMVMTRSFDAPRRLVYDAWTKPEHVARWWCCTEQGFSMPTCEIDFRVGGAFRFVTRAPDGSEFPLKGVYREIVAPSRVVHTQIFDVAPYASQETVITMTFEQRGNQTLFTSHALYPSVEARDGHLASGVDQGAGLALDRLEQIARSLGSLAGESHAHV